MRQRRYWGSKSVLGIMLPLSFASIVMANDGPAMLPIFGRHSRCAGSTCGYTFTAQATYTRKDGTKYTVYHPGWDMNLSDPNDDGQPVFAIADGTVKAAETNPPDEWGSVVIKHSVNGQTFYSQYGHCKEVLVSDDQPVKKGTCIARVGGVPNYNPHLHWEIRMPAPVHPSPEDRNYFSSTYLATLSNVTKSYRDPEPFVAKLDIDYRKSKALNDRNPYGYTASPVAICGSNFTNLAWWFAFDPNDTYNTDGTSRNCYLSFNDNNSAPDGGVVFDALGGARRAYFVGWEKWNLWEAPEGPRGNLGLPITDSYRSISVKEVWRQDFQKGYIENGVPHGYNPCAPGWTESNTWSPQFSYLFADAYDRNGAVRGIGSAMTKVDLNWVSFSKTTAYCVQKFSGGSRGNGTVVYDPQNYVDNPAGTNEAYYLYGKFYTYWTTVSAVGPWVLGAPTTDRVGSAQYFKYGRMVEVTLSNGYKVVKAYDRTNHLLWTSPQYSAKVVAVYDETEQGEAQKETIIPASFTLSQNYPNPFNASTVIGYELTDAGHISIDVFNILGQKVTSLVNDWQEAGKHTVSWAAYQQSSGIYFYRIQAGNRTETKKMVLVK
ncbi:MAG: peptidoglycan DD-metalloendopeptidase family protein [Parcubacteria group bacterium]